MLHKQTNKQTSKQTPMWSADHRSWHSLQEDKFRLHVAGKLSKEQQIPPPPPPPPPPPITKQTNKQTTNQPNNQPTNQPTKQIQQKQSNKPSAYPRCTWPVCLLVGWLLNVPATCYSVSPGRICSDNFTCCHTEIEVADQTFYLT